MNDQAAFETLQQLLQSTTDVAQGGIGTLLLAQHIQVLWFVVGGGAVLISAAIIVHALITRKKA